MARTPTIAIRETLCKLFPARRLRALARASGAVQRERKVDIAALFWTLVLGFAVGGERSIATLRRAYERATGQCLEESSFYDRFTPGLVKLLKAAVAEGLDQMREGARALRGPLAAFRDLVLADATVMRLKDLLAGVYPACRTNHTRAALKLHAVLSVTGASRQSVKLTAERVHDGPVLKVGPWVRGRLLLFDLGYFRYQLFACITRNGGYFLSRLKRHANPLIVAVHRVHRGRALELHGKRLQEVLPQLERQVLDVEIEVRFPRRRYAGRVHRHTQRLRLIGLLDSDSGQYHLYCTNIPADKLAAEDVRAVYAARWQVELLFKELKSEYRIDELPSRRRAVVEALVYAALLSFIASRRLFAVVQRKLRQFADRLPEQRWARLFAAIAQDLLLLLVRPPRETRITARLLCTLLLHEAVDPNRNRPTLIAAVEMRRHRYRTKTA
ncbi:MAG: IS4 family transposase [Gammaproteobacteria bacterium]|nr:IS4 family transposase [Gammaproteobacteria bacterium]